MHQTKYVTVGLWVFVAAGTLCAQSQRRTIPDAIKSGGVSSVASVPSGQNPTMEDILRVTDVAVMGWIGEPHGYLSDDQSSVYTDYPLRDPVYLYPPELAQTVRDVPPIVVTELGGTVNVNGAVFTEKQSALAPFQPGARGLFLLQRSGTKYIVAKKYYGAFDINGDIFMPLMAREDFVPEYRGIPLSDALQRIASVLVIALPRSSFGGRS